MDSIEQIVETGPTDEAVEREIGRVVADLGSALGVLLISLGTRSGLWAALAGAGASTVAEVSGRVGVDPALVREWLRAQAAAGYLVYDPATETYTLPPATAVALLAGPGAALVEACLPMLVSMTEGFDEFSAAFAGGAGFGWHQRTPGHWHGTDALTRLTLPAEAVAAAIAELPDVVAALRAGGAAADIGCGYGAPTLAIAESYPSARVWGFDYHDASIMQARAAAATSGGSVRFEVATATEFPDGPGLGYDLITFFDSLHDLGDPGAALTRARRALAPGGAVLLFEPPAADTVADNLNPTGRMYYAISTLVCTPNAVAQRAGSSSAPLGTLAGAPALRELAGRAGFSSARRVPVPTPMNLVLELRP